MPLRSRKISPFKFLKSYQIDDIDSYYGRKKETTRLYDLYKDSSLIVLHGPSGSGKTSLIYCGLLNRAHLKKGSVLSIRRDNNFITSIKKKLFIHNDNNGSILEDQSVLLDNFLNSFSELKRISKGIETIDEMTLDVEDEILRLKKKKSKSIVSSTDVLVEDIEGKIIKNTQVLEHYVIQRDASIQKLTASNQKVIETSNEISKYFRQKNKVLHHVPLIIFDQFEELFVYGNKEEINKFGLFLKLIFDHKIPFNIIISLREEYFGHLDQLQNYIPNIFYRKIRLAHPNKDTIRSIIDKSFAKFNINQYKDHTIINDRELLTQKEKENRIDQIIEQIKIQDGSDTSYHLPFLQVYLDSLYKMDYQRTYPERVPDTIIKEYGEYPPLEFKEQEIKDFGSIKNVLEHYIREVNHKIINNTSNKLNNRNQHKDSVIKLLRHFKTKNDHKKRIPLSKQKNGIYIIDHEKLLNKIQIDIWGNSNDYEYNSTISEIIEELTDRGILTIGSDYVELSHDIIAKVISGMRTEEDFRLLIKRDFDSSFAIYHDTKRKEDLLNLQQVHRVRQYKDYIINAENIEEFKRKQEFFDKSILYNEKVKKEQQSWLDSVRDKEKILIKKYARVILLVFTIFLIILLYFLNNIAKSNDIYRITSDAFRVYKIDKTRSFWGIMKSNKMLNEDKDILSKEGISLVNNFKNELYKNYIKNPFYLNSIDLGLGHIINTKTRREGENDSITLFALTSTKKLIVRSLNYRKEGSQKEGYQGKNKFDPLNNIIAYEPFTVKDTTFIFAAQHIEDKIALCLFDDKGTRHYIDTKGVPEEVFSSTSIIGDIEQLKDNSFLIGINKTLYQINLQKSKEGLFTASIVPIEELLYNIRRIKSFGNMDYLVLYGSKSLFFKRNDSINSELPKQFLNKIDSIYSFEIVADSSKQKLLLGLEGSVEEINLNNLSDSEKHNVWHDKKISSIDVNKKNGQILLGSFDNTASLWSSDYRLLKQFIGHTDAIHNVSFVKGNPEYVITSGEDQKIKIWNINSITDTVDDKEIEYIKVKYQNKSKNLSLRITQKDTKKSIIITTKDNAILLEDSSKKTDTLFGHTDKIRNIDFSEDGSYLVSGSSDNKAIIWKLAKSKTTYDSIQTLTTHTNDVIDVEFYKNDLLLTASKDNTVQIYKREKDKNQFIQIPSIIRHEYGIKAATFYNENYIISIDVKNIVKKWEFTKFDSLVKARTYKIK